MRAIAETNLPEEANLIVQKLPSDIGIHRNPRKGTLNAPERIMEGFKFNHDVLLDEVFPDEFDLEETQERIRENTEDLMKYDKPILSIGGDHSVSFPVIKTLKQKHPDLKLVWLDSHLDLKEKVDDHVSHDVVVRELLGMGFSEEEVCFVGTTKIDEDEKAFLENREIKIYRPEEIEEFLREFNSSEQPVYLSIDIDVLREELAHGTGYPDGELEVEELEKVIEAVKPGFADIVEVAPPFDRKGETVKNAREILQTVENNLSL